MEFHSQLILGKIVKRYKRFLADIILDQDHNNHKKGELITVHTPNTGSMKTCWEEGWPALISFHDNPKRKLKYTLEMTHNGSTWIGLHTGHPNKLTMNSIRDGLISELSGFDHLRPEVKIGKSRIDIMLYNGELKSPEKRCFVEVKNVTLLGKKNRALFPDAISERGQKHLQELIQIKKNGDDAAIFFVVQREDVESFSPAGEIDPVYAKLLKECQKARVKILAYQFSPGPKGIFLKKKLPVILD